jgi:hypothetical protein
MFSLFDVWGIMVQKEGVIYELGAICRKGDEHK